MKDEAQFITFSDQELDTISMIKERAYNVFFETCRQR